ncbi:hypothetical protein ONZ45_g1643 [Pleurotus djamor]|nr:hypothetical protein ONZ45_g1643 [Pleurotus djamor]
MLAFTDLVRILTLGLSASQVVANPLPGTATVKLDSATLTGYSTGRVNRFLGIPYAKPPVGTRRFRLPEPIPAYTGNIKATHFGPSCPQQAFKLPLPDGLTSETTDLLINTIFKVAFPDSEDCLSLNVVTPESAAPTSKLPVIISQWIFGGGFQFGGASQFDFSQLVEKSILREQPFIYVSLNYRREVKEAGVGNLGLHDQREAMRWVQKYISNFGGDPSRVTLWGQSAGAISSSLHMLSNNGNNEGLFQGAFMQSGSPIPVGDITHGQPYYDMIVHDTGCSKAVDTLDCLRGVPYSKLKDAIFRTPSITGYRSLLLTWLPRADGVFLSDAPQRLVQQGKVANVPFVTGDTDDEGTIFSLANLNITTSDQLKDYIRTVYFPSATEAQLDALVVHYPQDPSQGSPYGTGPLHMLSPQFKRLASIQGDAVFQAPRRFFLEQRSGMQNTWAFLSKRFKSTPFLGSFHGSDLADVYLEGELAEYIINFVNHLDPNGRPGSNHLNRTNWPKYTQGSPNLLTFSDDLFSPRITQDTFRRLPMDFLTRVTLANPV